MKGRNYVSIEKMLLVNIAGQVKNLDRTISKCIESECFHIESAVDSVNTESTGFTQLREDNPYKDALNKIVSIDFENDLKFSKTDFSEIKDMSFKYLSDYADEISEKMGTIIKEISDTTNAIAQYEQILLQLKHLHGMDIDMESLYKCKHLHVRFGKLPVDSYPKLEYYGSDQFVFVH